MHSKMISRRVKRNKSYDQSIKKNTISKEVEFWRRYAKYYPNLEKTGPFRDLSEVIKEMLARDNMHGNWLDVGCGPAGMAKILIDNFQDVSAVVGVDFVLGSLARERERFMEKLSLIEASIDQPLAFISDGAFDGVISNLVIPYVIYYGNNNLTGMKAMQGIFYEMARIIKPGGRFIFSSPKKDVNFCHVFVESTPDMLNLKEMFTGDWTRPLQGIPIIKHALEIQLKGKRGLYTFLNPDDSKSLLEKAGFCDISQELTFSKQAWVYSATRC